MKIFKYLTNKSKITNKALLEKSCHQKNIFNKKTLDLGQKNRIIMNLTQSAGI
jgi:hypothetical protein